jgi:hypothetical protein
MNATFSLSVHFYQLHTKNAYIYLLLYIILLTVVQEPMYCFLLHILYRAPKVGVSGRGAGSLHYYAEEGKTHTVG